MKIFWDTNIALDLIYSKREYHKNASELLSFHLSYDQQIIINSLTLANSNYILEGIYKLKDSLERVKYLNTLCTVCKMNSHQADRALNSGWKDFEDALQYQSALSVSCDAIITRDHKGFAASLIPIYTPEQFLEEQNNAT
jgi:predicted nucleic acid-binding protein